jgi:hypothetical protein
VCNLYNLCLTTITTTTTTTTTITIQPGTRCLRQFMLNPIRPKDRDLVAIWEQPLEISRHVSLFLKSLAKDREMQRHPAQELTTVPIL